MFSELAIVLLLILSASVAVPNPPLLEEDLDIWNMDLDLDLDPELLLSSPETGASGEFGPAFFNHILDDDVDVPVDAQDLRLENEDNYNLELMPLDLQAYEQGSESTGMDSNQLFHEELQSLGEGRDFAAPQWWKSIQTSSKESRIEPQQDFVNQNSIPSLLIATPQRPRRSKRPPPVEQQVIIERCSKTMKDDCSKTEPSKTVKEPRVNTGPRQSERATRPRKQQSEEWIYEDTKLAPAERTNDMLEQREKILSSSGREKLEAMIEMWNSLPPTNTLTVQARGFASSQLRPAMDCLYNHHNGNMDSFLKRWGQNFYTSHFAKKYCDGLSEACPKRWHAKAKANKRDDFEKRFELMEIKDPQAKLDRYVELYWTRISSDCRI